MDEIALLNRKIEALERERDAYLAYGAFMLSESTMPPTREGWPPFAAVARVKEDALADTESLQGWSRRDIASLERCREAASSSTSPS